jgi:GTP-dependent phosphoenolpyruvate carboxykinase
MTAYTAANVNAPASLTHEGLKQWIGEIANLSRAVFDRLMHIDIDAWNVELSQHEQWFDKLRRRLPHQLSLKRELLALRFANRRVSHQAAS